MDDDLAEEGDLYMDETEETTFETGQIMRVFVQDFMCHNKLTIDFGRHVNFVTGANGSGKSAVVAAVQLCLGATARSTGRGSNLAGLIREGCDGPAIMRITLLNEGNDAYKPYEYGKRLMVERRIARKGGGGYRLLDEKGVAVSHDKKELALILRTFNINVDNPCCVLTQEESIKFIQGQEKEKYAFFLKATGLERAKDELDSAHDHIEATRAELDRVQGGLQGKKDAVMQFEGELKKLRELDKHDGKIRNCLAKLEWMEVCASDDVLQLLHEKKEKAEKEVLLATINMSEAESQVTADDDEEMKARHSELQEDLSRAVQDAKLKRTAVEQKNVDFNAVQMNIRLVTANEADHIKRLRITKEEIKNLRDRAKASADENGKELLEAIEKCDNNGKRKREEESDVTSEMNNAAQGISELERERDQHYNQKEKARRDTDQTRTELERLSDTSQGRAAAFGRNVGEVLQDIKKGRFNDEVMGPLGLYVKIADGCTVWGEAIEKHMGRMLSAFIVTNTDDQRTLVAILKHRRCDFQHTVVCQNRNPRYNVSRIQNALTISDTVTIENDMVFNCLIDQTKMEGTIVVHDEEDCRRFYSCHNGRDSFNDNKIRSALTKKGTKIEIRYGNQGSFSNPAQFKRLLAADVREMQSALQEELESHQRKSREAQNECEAITGRITQAKNIHSKSSHALQMIRNEIKVLSKKKLALKADQDERREAGCIDTTNLEREEAELEEHINSTSEEKVKYDQMAEECQAELKELRGVLAQADKKKDSILKSIKDQESILQTYVEKAQSRTRDIHRAGKIVVAKEKDVNDIAKLIEEREIAREIVVQNARSKTATLIVDWDGQPIKMLPNDTKEKLKAESARLKAQVERDRRDVGLEGRTITSVHENLERARKDYDDSAGGFDALSTAVMNHSEDFDRRKKMWNDSLRTNAKKISRCFDTYLQKKGFAGTVKFSHSERTLHLTCQTDNTNDTTRVKDVRQLSGGERSYTTLCLLLALGHVIESPFRLMDEYDVFLDEVSRKVTLDELQKYALTPQQRGRQLLIITPNNLNDVITSNDVRIKRMAAPQRNSVRGPQQAVLDYPNAN